MITSSRSYACRHRRRSLTWTWRNQRRLRQRKSATAISNASTELTPAQIIDGVVLSQESITDDPKGTGRGGDIHSGEGRDTGSTGVEDVVGALEGVRLAAKVQGKVGQVGDLGAVDLVLAVPRFGGADSGEGLAEIVKRIERDLLLVQHLGDIRRHNDQRSSGIDRGTGALQLEFLIAKADLLELDLPVSLSSDGDVGNLALERGIVCSTKDAFASIIFG
jgi:hypothetical protein